MKKCKFCGEHHTPKKEELKKYMETLDKYLEEIIQRLRYENITNEVLINDLTRIIKKVQILEDEEKGELLEYFSSYDDIKKLYEEIRAQKLKLLRRWPHKMQV